MLSRLEFFITETFISMRRHPAMAFAASICIAASLFVAGIVGLIVMNVNHFTDTTLSQVRFNVYFQAETSRQDAWAAYKKILKLPAVETAKFIPAEKATTWTENPELQKLLPANPLPDSVQVKATALEDIEGLKTQIRAWSDVKKVQAPGYIQTLINIRTAVTKSGTVLGIVLFVLALIIIHHTIELTLYARRREMFIMSLVGATPGTVATPFLLEGIVYGLLGGAVAIGSLLPLYHEACRQLNVLSDVTLLGSGPEMTLGILVILGAGAVLGLVGSIISVIKFVRSPRSRLTNA
jgi:cell division transport system permease protein